MLAERLTIRLYCQSLSYKDSTMHRDAFRIFMTKSIAIKYSKTRSITMHPRRNLRENNYKCGIFWDYVYIQININL